MQWLVRIKKAVWILSAIILMLFLLGNYIFPKVFHKPIPYQFYHVLTDSMEPLIAPESFVCVRTYEGADKLEKGDIITFRAKRFGEEIVITHRYSHSEINDEGEVIYRTHAQGRDVLDVYETTEDDILGNYVFHVPYAGKILQFFKSIFGFLWICEMVTILLMQKWLEARWSE